MFILFSSLSLSVCVYAFAYVLPSHSLCTYIYICAQRARERCARTITMTHRLTRERERDSSRRNDTCVCTGGPALSGQPVDDIDACCVERMRCYSVVEASLSANSNGAMDYSVNDDDEEIDMDTIMGFKEPEDTQKTCETIPYTMKCESRSEEEPAWMQTLHAGLNHVTCGGDTPESHEGAYGCCECDSMFAKCIAHHQMVFNHDFVHFSKAVKDTSVCSAASQHHQLPMSVR